MIKRWMWLTLCAGSVSVPALAESASEIKRETERAQRVEISRAWSPVAPPGTSAHAGYFTVRNRSSEPLTITSVSSPRYGRIDMHHSRTQEGVASMAALDSVAIPAHDTTQFAPGGMHLMMRPVSSRQKGEEVPVTLHFKSGETLSFALRVGALPSDMSTQQAADNSKHGAQQTGELDHAH